jgi:hypothetical protein
MIYAKILTGGRGIGDHSSASDLFKVVSGEWMEFVRVDGEIFLNVVNKGSGEMVQVDGDAWIMSESGRTLSQYAIPFEKLNPEFAEQARSNRSHS